MALRISMGKNSFAIPLFAKEGLGEIFLNKMLKGRIILV
jgi:hypothetical protein